MRVEALRDPSHTVQLLKQAADANDPFHICILDIIMPPLDGFEVAREIRKQPSPIREIPLLAFSSSTAGGLQKSLAAGFNGFLTKPVRREKIIKMLEGLLSQD